MNPLPDANNLPHTPAVMADALARWPSDDDLALGCECADPALQIERWQQEAAGLGAQSM